MKESAVKNATRIVGSIVALLVVLSAIRAHAQQDITGTWQGSLQAGRDYAPW